MTTATYLWDAVSDNVLNEDDGVTTTVYTNEPNQYGDLVSHNDGTDSHWYHFNARGDTGELTDDSETVTDTYLYDAWGNVISSTGSSEVPFQFVGKHGYVFDAALNWYYVRARWYRSNNGRWKSQDPLKYIDGLSLFNYAKNSPLNVIDPTGLLSIWETLIQDGLLGQNKVNAGSVSGGDLENRSYEGCAHELLARLFAKGVLKGAKDATLDVMKKLLLQLGKLEELANIKKVFRAIDAIRDPSGALQKEALKSLSKRIGISPKVMTRLYENTKQKLIGECRNVQISWKESKPGSNQSAECTFTVCAQVEGILTTTVKDWSITGFCYYACAGVNCCCGNGRVFSFSSEGSDSGGAINVKKFEPKANY